MVYDFSIWEYETYRRSWDVCIIGSGINGLSAGISLLEKNPALNVLIVDRWFIPLGASTRNAGFSCFGSPSEILDDIANVGEEAAMALVGKRWQGLLKLRSRLENSNAQYETNGGYELYNEEDFEKVNSKLDYLNGLMQSAIGKACVFNSVKVPAGIRDFDRAIFNHFEGQLHAGYMIEHLKKLYTGLGGNIWTGLNIDHIEEDNEKVILGSVLSIPIEARKLIVTTNAFAAHFFPTLDIHGARNHVLVTSPIEGLTWKGCFHYDKGFYYFRNIGNRILLGGARNMDFETENTIEFGKNPLILETLERFLYHHLADRHSCKIDFQWSGIIGVGSQKMPIVKAISPKIFIGLRCSGMGIALASLIGEELAALISNSASN